MMDDGELGIDLGAWEVPPPAAGLADAVLARMREPRRPSARIPAPTARRRWWLAAGGAVAAVAGVAALIHWGTARAPGNSNGNVFAARATHLELAPSAVELDLGSELRWQRAGHQLTVEQPQGAATWRVDGSDVLAIEAGASVASIEATGASLRVEVHMNLGDAKLIGASAGLAALVTVVVYDGQVKVTGGGQTVPVLPGSTVEVRPGAAPRDVPAVGAAPDRVRQLEDRIRELEAQVGSAGDPPQQVLGTPDDAPAVCDEVSCVLSDYEGACCERYRKPRLAGALDQPAIDKGLQLAEGAVVVCADTRFKGSLTATLKVAPDGHVSSVKLRPQRTVIESCVKTALAAARFDASQLGASFSHTFEFDATSCNFTILMRDGTDAYAAGSYQKAYAAFETAQRCRPNDATAARALMAACKLGDRAKAGPYYPSGGTPDALAVCEAAGIRAADLKPACDAAELVSRGAGAYAAGSYRQALVQFEKAVLCKPTGDAIMRAFMAACSLRDKAKASYYYLKSPAATKPAISICVRVGIFEADLKGAPQCDHVALKDQGTAAYGSGSYSVALRYFEKSVACKRTDDALMRAFMAACSLRDEAKARAFYEEAPAAADLASPVCVRNGIDPALWKAQPCDPSTIEAEGAYNGGRYGEALAKFQRALACKPGPAVATRAFLAACRSRNQGAAAELARRFPDEARANAAVCIAEGISDDQLGLSSRGPINIAPSVLRGMQTVGTMSIPADALRIAAAGGKKLVGSWKLCLDTVGRPTTIRALKRTGNATYDEAIERGMRGWLFRPYLDHGTPVAVCTAVTLIANDSCDAWDLAAKGTEEYGRGNYAAALAMFELSLGCKSDGSTGTKAFMAACRLHNVEKAKYFYKKYTSAARNAVSVCVRENITQADLEGP